MAVQSTRAQHLTGLERGYLASAQAWVHEEAELPGRVVQAVSSAGRAAVRRAINNDTVAAAIERGTRSLLDRFEYDPNPEDAPSSLRPGAGTLAAAERAAALERADELARAVLRHHRALVAVQGAATGAASINVVTALAALAADVTSSTLLLLRGTAATLSSYGDVDDPRTTAVVTVLLAGETDPVARHRGLLRAAGIVRGDEDEPRDLAQVVAGQAGARVLNDAIETILRRRVTRGALTVVPVVGAAAGALTATWMLDRTWRTARHVGRLHVLHRHAGLGPWALGREPRPRR